MSFNFIYNPLTNEKYSIFSYEGKSLLKQYIKEYQTGGSGRDVTHVIGPGGLLRSIPLEQQGNFNPNSGLSQLTCEQLKGESTIVKNNIEKVKFAAKTQIDNLNEHLNKLNKEKEKKCVKFDDINPF